MTDDPVDLDKERDKRRAALLLLSSKKHPYGDKCFTCAWVADEKSRTIACSKCGRVIEPFDCVLELARNFEEYARNRDRLRHEIATLRSNEAELRKVVDSLKGMERRLLKDWRAIVGQVADHLDAMAATQVKEQYRTVVSQLSRLVRSWRPKDVMPRAVAG